MLIATSISAAMAVLALVISVLSIIYSYKSNKPRIELQDCEILSTGKHPLVRFVVSNPTPTSVTLTKIEFFTKEGERVAPDLNYYPEACMSPIPFPGTNIYPEEDIPEYKKPLFLFDQHTIHPHKDAVFQYYLEKAEPEMKFKICYKEPVHRVNRELSIPVHFFCSNQSND